MSEHLEQVKREWASILHLYDRGMWAERHADFLIEQAEKAQDARDAVGALWEALDDPALLEVLADLEHQRWANWMRYQQVAPPEKKADWPRKTSLVYWGLTNEEQESDRIEARKTLAVIRNRMDAAAPAAPEEPDAARD